MVKPKESSILENGIDTNKENPAQDTLPTNEIATNNGSATQPTNGTDADNSSPVVQTAQTVSGASLNSGNKGIPFMNYKGYNYKQAESKVVYHVLSYIRRYSGRGFDNYLLEELSELVQEHMVELVKFLNRPAQYGGRDMHWTIPKDLSPMQGALIVHEKEKIRLICSKEKLNDPTENGILTIYKEDGEHAGIYIEIGNSQINEWATGLVGAPDRKWRNEFSDALRVSAERASECDDPSLIFLKNGILDYETKELIPFSPDYVSLKKSPVSLPDSEPPVPVHMKPDGSWMTFWEWLDSLVPYAGGKELLIKLVGAVLRNHHNWRIMVTFFNKTGRNGKSTFLRMLKACVGSERVMTSTIVSLCDARFGLTNLPGCALVTCEDSDSGDYVQTTSRMKCIISHDTVQVERKNKDEFSYTPHAMVVCAANDLPRTRDKGAPWLDRNFYVPFTGQFTGKNDDKTISSEWVVSKEFCEYMVYQALIKTENYYELPEPEEAVKLKREFMADNDSVVDFFNYMEEHWKYDFIPNPCAWAEFKGWLKETRPNTNPPTQKSFITHFTDIAVASGRWLYPKEASGKSRRFQVKAWCVEEGSAFSVVHSSMNSTTFCGSSLGSPFLNDSCCSGVVRKEMWEYCRANNITPKDLGDKYLDVRKSLELEE